MKNSKLRIWMPWAKRAVSVLVIAAVIWATTKSFGQLDESNFKWSEFNFAWLIMAAGSYMLAMGCGCLYWHLVMVSMGQRPRVSKSMTAFFYSQLAKYIPGKAMVVVVRSASVSDENVKPSVAAVSVFVETLTWISVAASIALLTLATMSLLQPDSTIQFDYRWQIAAAVLFLVTSIPTLPPVARRIVAIVTRKRFRSVQFEIEQGINYRTWTLGWVILPIGWCLNATSLWLVLQALPNSQIGITYWPLCLLVVSLATVIGFVSFLPGGFGVRELVMIPLLGGVVGPTSALVAAISLRLIWILSEIAIASVLFVAERTRKGAKLSKRAADSRIAI